MFSIFSNFVVFLFFFLGSASLILESPEAASSLMDDPGWLESSGSCVAASDSSSSSHCCSPSGCTCSFSTPGLDSEDVFTSDMSSRAGLITALPCIIVCRSSNHLKPIKISWSTRSSSDSIPTPLYRRRSAASLYLFLSDFIFLRHCFGSCACPRSCNFSNIVQHTVAILTAPINCFITHLLTNHLQCTNSVVQPVSYALCHI